MEVKPTSDACCRFCFILSLLCITTATVHHVIPDDYDPIESGGFTLQHYLNNTNKYFISHNDLQFLPGKYNLTDNIFIKNIKNFSIGGNRTNGVISTVITCTAPYGVIVMNSSNIIIKSL